MYVYKGQESFAAVGTAARKDLGIFGQLSNAKSITLLKAEVFG